MSKLIRSLVGVAALLAANPAASLAQPGPLTTTDAALIPAGTFRVRMLTQWTRYDGLFGVPGIAANVDVPLAYGLNVDSLGVAQIPSLATTQSQIRSISGLSQFMLNLGKLATGADTRVVSSPLVVEYGLSRRLMVGFLVPLVQTRSTVVAQLNQKNIPGAFNVGPAQISSTVLGNNAIAVSDLRTAATSLQNLLNACATNPNQTQCQPVNGHQAQAQALVQSSTAFANTAESLYGTVAVTGQPFVPVTGSAAQTAIANALASLGTQYGTYLGSDPVTDTLTGAAAPAAMRQLQSLLTGSPIGHDTLGTSDRIGFGDLELRAAFQLFDTFGDTSAAADRLLRARATLTGAFRLGTGSAGSHNRFFDTGTGYGQPGVQLGAVADLLFHPRLTATVAGSYTAQFRETPVPRPANVGAAPFPITSAVPASFSAGNVIDAMVMPRLRITRVFTIDGTYLLRHVGADHYTVADSVIAALPADAQTAGYASATFPFGRSASTEQDVGFGFSYSTATSGEANAGRLLAELSFRHFEAVKGSGGPIPKSRRDQLEVRIYPR